SYALQRTFEASLILGVAALLGTVAGADFIIEVVAGPKFAGAAAALRIEGLALLASFVMAGWGFGLLALHRHVQLLVANAVALTVSAVLTIELARTHGAQGAAIASACGETVLAALYLLFLLRSDRDLQVELEVPLKVAVAALPALAIALLAGLPSALLTLVTLAVFAILLIVLRAIPDELRDLLPARLRRRPR